MFLVLKRGVEHGHELRVGEVGWDRALLSATVARPRTRVSPWCAKSCQNEHARTKCTRVTRRAAAGGGCNWRRQLNPEPQPLNPRHRRRLPAAATGGYQRLQPAATSDCNRRCYGRCYRRRLRTVLRTVLPTVKMKCQNSSWFQFTFSNERQQRPRCNAATTTTRDHATTTRRESTGCSWIVYGLVHRNSRA